MTGPLLSTKLHRPPIDRNHVCRPHLLARLNQHRDRPLTLVSAPAGYGKSILISFWLETSEDPGVWISLNDSDGDLRTFMSYFIAAVQKLYPDACPNTRTQLNAIDLPPLEVLSTSLLNELDRIKQPFILVLDDYSLIKKMAIHDLISQILKHPPRFFHLVIVGRRDPPLQIASLRAQSQLLEIRAEDLCFSTAETETLLNQLLGIKINATTVDALVKKTEGWVTGLRLAALSMRQQSDIDPKLLEPHVDAQYVMEYLFTEVFSHHPPEFSQYLLGTAVLDRFCGPLCEAVCLPGAEPFTCEIGGWEFIAWLKKENIFVIPLDPEKRWFRYHHMFRKLLFNLLNRKYSNEDINALHIQASVWYSENGLIEEALQHALSAGDTPAAVRLVERHGYQLMNDQQWSRLSQWLDLLPRTQVEHNPELLLLEAWLYHIRHDVSNQMRCLAMVEAMEDSCPPETLPVTRISANPVKGQLEAMRGFKHYIAANGEVALGHLRHASELIPSHYKRARVFAHIYRLGAYQMIGELATGLPIYQEEMQDAISKDPSYHSTYLTNLCFIYWIDADLNAMRQTAEIALIAADDHQLPDTVPYVLYFQGIFHYHRNELKIAEEKLTKVVEIHHFTSPVNYAHSSLALALTFQAQNKFAKAREISEALLSHAIETNNADMVRVTQAFEAELALRQGRFAKSNQLASRLGDLKLQPIYRFYMPQLVLIHNLLVQGTTDSRRRAADLLDRSLIFFKSIRNKRFQIDLLALQALLHDSQKNKPAALRALAEALAIAELGGFIRLFVDLGPQMADLLKQLVKQNVSLKYIGEILDAFKESEHSAMQDESDHPTAAQSPPLYSQLLVEPLTNRELDVLELLVQRMQNKEIADKLFVSVETIKGHLKNIYRKLNVSKRRDAVEKAQTLGILKQQ